MGDTESSEVVAIPNQGEGASRIESPPQTNISFPNLVYKSQEMWRRNWQTIKKESTLSELEENELSSKTSEGLFRMVTDSLPSYIPWQVRDKVVENHPTPLFNIAVISDPRRENALLRHSNLSYEVGVPVEVPEKDTEKYVLGINALNEIATDKVTEDIVNYQITAASTDVGIPMTENRRRLIRGFSREMQDILTGYKTYRKKVQEALGDKATFAGLKTLVAQSAMSGDNEPVDTFLKDKGKGGLNQFAIELGSSLSTDQKIQKQDKWKERLGIIATSLFRVGHVYTRYPGVININAAPFPANISYGWVHETVHYLTTDENHFGLFKMQYSEKGTAKTPQEPQVIENPAK